MIRTIYEETLKGISKWFNPKRWMFPTDGALLKQTGEGLYLPAEDKFMKIISQRGSTMTIRNLYFYERFWGWLRRVFKKIKGLWFWRRYLWQEFFPPPPRWHHGKQLKKGEMSMAHWIRSLRRLYPKKPTFGE